MQSLLAIAAAAPLLGLLGTVFGIHNSFPGMGTEQWTAIAIITGLLSQALMPTAIGIAVAVISFCGYRFLLGSSHDLALEMEAAALDLMNQLSRLPHK